MLSQCMIGHWINNTDLSSVVYVFPSCSGSVIKYCLPTLQVQEKLVFPGCSFTPYSTPPLALPTGWIVRLSSRTYGGVCGRGWLDRPHYNSGTLSMAVERGVINALTLLPKHCNSGIARSPTEPPLAPTLPPVGKHHSGDGQILSLVSFNGLNNVVNGT